MSRKKTLATREPPVAKLLTYCANLQELTQHCEELLRHARTLVAHCQPDWPCIESRAKVVQESWSWINDRHALDVHPGLEKALRAVRAERREGAYAFGAVRAASVHLAVVIVVHRVNASFREATRQTAHATQNTEGRHPGRCPPEELEAAMECFRVGWAGWFDLLLGPKGTELEIDLQQEAYALANLLNPTGGTPVEPQCMVMTAKELALRYGLDPEGTRKKLERHAKKCPDCYISNDQPRHGEPEKFFRVADVVSVLKQ